MNTASDFFSAEMNRSAVVPRTDVVLEHLAEMGEEIIAQKDMATVLQSLNRHLHQLVDADSFIVYLLDPDSQSLSLAFGIEAGNPLTPHSIPLSDPTAHAARCTRERRKLVIDAPHRGTQGRICAFSHRSALFFPMTVGDKVLGVMSIQSKRPHAFGEGEQMIFQLLNVYGAIALDNVTSRNRVNASLTMLREAVDEKRELENAYQQLKEASITDTLTGLQNRRFLREQLDGDISACLRRYDKWLNDPSQPQPDDIDLIFFLVDIDYFKEVNDSHGHAAGDMVLVQMAERFREVSRDTDYLVRWGGEEFLIVARSTNRVTAGQIAERIRAAVAGRDFILNDGLHLSITCSVGYSCFPHLPTAPHQLSWTETVELADQALYSAKLGGRNTCSGAHGMTLERQPLPSDNTSGKRKPPHLHDTVDFHI